MKKALGFLTVLIFLLGIIGGITYLIYLPKVVSPPKTVEIFYGTPVPKIAEILEKEGIIYSRYLFLIVHAIERKKLEAGEYEFRGKLSVIDVYNYLKEGRYKLYRITVKEGYDIYDIAKELEKKKICRAKDFLKYALSEEIVHHYGLSTPSVEGFLFPDTYFFSKGTHPLKVIDVMYKNFLKKTEKLRKELKRKKLDLETWVIVASMVEKETMIPKEKPIIAAIIYNRLNKGMKLQIDPTVIYAAKRRGIWKGKLLKKFYKLDDPYNTYFYYGLPPGPISNPGLSSLEAALRPAKVDYLYFVAKPDMSGHLFARTYLEHLMNLRRVGRR